MIVGFEFYGVARGQQRGGGDAFVHNGVVGVATCRCWGVVMSAYEPMVAICWDVKRLCNDNGQAGWFR